MLEPHLGKMLDQDLSRSEEFRKLVGPFAEAIFVNTQQGKFLVPVTDMQVGLKLRTEGHYGKDQLDYLSAICSKTTRVLVVGAHIGALVIPLASMCRNVVAIECNPPIFELLKINLFLNQASNCRPICIAASDRAANLEFLQSTVNTGGSKRKPVESWHYYFDEPNTTFVEAAPIDEVLPGEEFDVILMDIEGSEYFALNGMQRILSKADILEVEFLTHSLKYVAGISIDAFTETILPHFSWMRLSTGEVFAKEQIEAKLKDMFARDQNDEGLVFHKTNPSQK